MKKFCISLYIILACIFLVSCSSSSETGNSEPVKKLPPELEKLPGTVSHAFEGTYYRFSVPDDYWVTSHLYENADAKQANIYMIHDYLREMAVNADREFDPDYYCVWILEESYEEYGKTALDICKEWEETAEQYKHTVNELHPEKLDVPVYIRTSILEDGIKTGFAMFDNPEGKLSYFSFIFCDDQMEEVFIDMVNNMEYVK